MDKNNDKQNNPSLPDAFFAAVANNASVSAMENGKASVEQKATISKWLMSASIGTIGFILSFIVENSPNRNWGYIIVICIIVVALCCNVGLGLYQSYVNAEYYEKYAEKLGKINSMAVGLAYVEFDPTNDVKKRELLTTMESLDEKPKSKIQKWLIEIVQSFILSVSILAVMVLSILSSLQVSAAKPCDQPMVCGALSQKAEIHTQER